jgi:hypothetical protein
MHRLLFTFDQVLGLLFRSSNMVSCDLSRLSHLLDDRPSCLAYEVFRVTRRPWPELCVMCVFSHELDAVREWSAVGPLPLSCRCGKGNYDRVFLQYEQSNY